LELNSQARDQRESTAFCGVSSFEIEFEEVHVVNQAEILNFGTARKCHEKRKLTWEGRS
jgi:hypothetical protein